MSGNRYNYAVIIISELFLYYDKMRTRRIFLFCRKEMECRGFLEQIRWDPSSDQFIYSGKSYILERICNQKNIAHDDLINEMKRRAELIRWMD